MAKYFRSEAAVELLQGLSPITEGVAVWADVSDPDPAKVFGPTMGRQGGQNDELFEQSPPPGGMPA
ncbi:MAG: hypothetical protein HYY53_05010 [candidate division NC10 bacterium]|nr:hypothetical protein [candidate division NC10 bacterium]MBI3079866.1 hypothetical protein [candidate division NC10 bacterium]MBI4414006.1 hypothetical protein [candidate division NC10 bacterium]